MEFARYVFLFFLLSITALFIRSYSNVVLQMNGVNYLNIPCKYYQSFNLALKFYKDYHIEHINLISLKRKNNQYEIKFIAYKQHYNLFEHYLFYNKNMFYTILYKNNRLVKLYLENGEKLEFPFYFKKNFPFKRFLKHLNKKFDLNSYQAIIDFNNNMVIINNFNKIYKLGDFI